MSQIKAFKHPIFGDLPVTIIDNQEFFGASEAAKALSFSNPRAAINNHVDDEDVMLHDTPTNSGVQQKKFVNESGLYSLIFGASKQGNNKQIQLKAKAFKRWVTSEVLPSIRKHGAYATPDTIENIINNPDFGIKLLQTLKSERDQRLRVEQERNQVVEQQRLDLPYTTFGKAVAGSNASINVGAFAKMMYEKHGINLGRNKMFAWLRENGFLIKSGRERNNPKQKYIEQGLFEVRPTLVSRTEGDIESLTTLITGKGQVKLSEILINGYKVVS